MPGTGGGRQKAAKIHTRKKKKKRVQLLRNLRRCPSCRDCPVRPPKEKLTFWPRALRPWTAALSVTGPAWAAR